MDLYTLILLDDFYIKACLLLIVLLNEMRLKDFFNRLYILNILLSSLSSNFLLKDIISLVIVCFGNPKRANLVCKDPTMWGVRGGVGPLWAYCRRPSSAFFARGCFYDLNLWPPGHTAATSPFLQGSPSILGTQDWEKLRRIYKVLKCKVFYGFWVNKQSLSLYLRFCYIWL